MTKSQRWFQLIDEVSVRPGQTAKQLAHRVGRSDRTIMRDIDDLAEIGIVIINDKGYRFLSKPFLPPLALTREEVVAVMLAQQLAQRQLDPKAAEALSSAVDKMRRGMGGPQQQAADGVEKHTAVLPGGALESDITTTLLTELSHAVAERLEITFAYRKRNGDDFELRQTEPLGLSFQEGRWYLHAFDLERQGERTFRLGRITSLRSTGRKFEPKVTFSAEKAAFHQWDLGEGDPVELSMTVSPGLARWFEENKPHPTVKVDGTTVTLSVNDPAAYLRWFASLDDAELVSPMECREQLGTRFQKLSQFYAHDRI